MAGTRREFVAISEPPVQDFSSEEIDLIAQIVGAASRMTAVEASQASHDALWDETDAGGSMSVAAGSVRRRDVRPDDVAWAHRELQSVAF